MFGPSLHPVVCRRTYVLLCTQCFQFVSIVHSRFFLRFSLTFIEVYNRYGTHSLCLFVLFDCVYITPLSTIFLLYSGGQFHWWRKPEDADEIIDLSQVTSYRLDWMSVKKNNQSHSYINSIYIPLLLWFHVYCFLPNYPNMMIGILLMSYILYSNGIGLYRRIWLVNILLKIINLQFVTNMHNWKVRHL